MEPDIKQIIKKIEDEYTRLSKAATLIKEAEENTTISAKLLDEYKDVANKTEAALTECQDRIIKLGAAVNELGFGHSVIDNKFKNAEQQVSKIVFEQNSQKIQLDRYRNDLDSLQKQMEDIVNAHKTNEINYQTVTDMYNALVKKTDQSAIGFADHIKKTHSQLQKMQAKVKNNTIRLNTFVTTVGIVSLIVAIFALIKAW